MRLQINTVTVTYSFANTMHDCTFTKRTLCNQSEAAVSHWPVTLILFTSTLAQGEMGWIAITWRCSIQTTLHIYLYAVQFGFLQGMRGKSSGLWKPTVFLMHHKLSIPIPPRTPIHLSGDFSEWTEIPPTWWQIRRAFFKLWESKTTWL